MHAPRNYDIAGMHCAACSTRLERVLNKLPDIEKASVNLANATAIVWPKENQTSEDFNADLSDNLWLELDKKVMAQTKKAGFTATPVKDLDSASKWEQTQQKAASEKKLRLNRLYPMIGFTIPLLIISMGHMMGITLPDFLEPHTSPKTFIFIQFVLTLPIVWLGRHFYTEGLKALWRRSPNMDSLVAVGTGAAFLYSIFNSILAFLNINPVHQAMNLYYESCAVLLTMIELGQYLEFTAKHKAGDAIGALMSIVPETALLLNDNRTDTQEVPVTAIRKGDFLLVKPGSRIPVDGKVIEGMSAVDLSLLTGESIPTPVEPGDSLTGGSVNGEGSIIMEATAVGADTRLSRIIRLVREAQGTKAPIARLADKVSFYFVPAVMIFAICAALLWLIFSQQPFTVALTVFVAVLVMACPCAMGLATPMSIMVATGRGAQTGVLIKNGASLEQASHITTLCFDKTGTLTTGKPELANVQIFPANGIELNETDVLTLASSLEGRSEHPLGLAIIRAAQKQHCEGMPVSNVEIFPGLGIQGTVSYKNINWNIIIGNETLIQKFSIQISENILQTLCDIACAGQTPLLMAISQDSNGKFELAAILSLADQLRVESISVIKRLKNLGLTPVMLTGDNERTAKSIAEKAGISQFAAGLLPAQKAEFIMNLKQKKEIVGMVGDGLNDAPALALADVGMAVGSGVDVSAEAGDIVLMRGDMYGVLNAIELSRATMRNIRQNLGWAFGYNILGLPVAAGLLAAFGGPMLSPMLAGTAMALSSFSVVSNALRLRWFNVAKNIME